MTEAIRLGTIAEVSTHASIHTNNGNLQENSSSWSATVTGGKTIGVGFGASGSVAKDGSLSGGVEGKIGFGAGGAILVCKKETGECLKIGN